MNTDKAPATILLFKFNIGPKVIFRVVWAHYMEHFGDAGMESTSFLREVKGLVRDSDSWNMWVIKVPHDWDLFHEINELGVNPNPYTLWSAGTNL